MESSPSPCKLDHGRLEPNAVAIYEEVMYRMLPLIHSSQGVTQVGFRACPWHCDDNTCASTQPACRSSAMAAFVATSWLKSPKMSDGPRHAVTICLAQRSISSVRDCGSWMECVEGGGA